MPSIKATEEEDPAPVRWELTWETKRPNIFSLSPSFSFLKCHQSELHKQCSLHVLWFLHRVPTRLLLSSLWDVHVVQIEQLLRKAAVHFFFPVFTSSHTLLPPAWFFLWLLIWNNEALNWDEKGLLVSGAPQVLTGKGFVISFFPKFVLAYLSLDCFLGLSIICNS